MADGSLSKKHDLFVRIQQRAAEATRRLAEKQEQEAAKPQQMYLPSLEEFMRAMPNPVARSSLFATVAKGRKKIHDGEIVLETPTFIIRFWGRQLDEAQADLWMQLMYEASKAPLGEQSLLTEQRCFAPLDAALESRCMNGYIVQCTISVSRSEERRVGKECRSRWS